MHELIHFTSENIFLIGSILVFTAIVVSKTGNKYGVPSLLIFLLVGMLFGSDGLGLVFDNYNLAQFLSIVALCVILFTGGLETKFKEIRPVSDLVSCFRPWASSLRSYSREHSSIFFPELSESDCRCPS